VRIKLYIKIKLYVYIILREEVRIKFRKIFKNIWSSQAAVPATKIFLTKFPYYITT